MEEENNNDDCIKLMTPMTIDHDNDNTNGSNAIENRASLTDDNNTDANNVVEMSLSSSFDEDNNKIQGENPIKKMIMKDMVTNVLLQHHQCLVHHCI